MRQLYYMEVRPLFTLKLCRIIQSVMGNKVIQESLQLTTQEKQKCLASATRKVSKRKNEIEYHQLQNDITTQKNTSGNVF